MTAHTSGSPVGDQRPPARARTLRGQAATNRVIRALLRTPLVCRAVGRRLVVIYVTGRRTGRRFAIPVAYTRRDEALLIGTPFPWVRNLRTGEPVMIRLKGRKRPADVQVLADEAGVVEYYGVMARDNHAFAGFNRIGLDESGEPDPGDLHLAWASGARVVRLTLR